MGYCELTSGYAKATSKCCSSWTMPASRKYLRHSYHGATRQIGANRCYPVHRDMLEIACRTCGAKAAYRLNVARSIHRTDAEAVATCTAARRPFRCRTSVHSTRRRASPSRGCDGAILRISDRIDMMLTMRIDVDFRRQRSDTFPFLASQLTQLLSKSGKSLKRLTNFKFSDAGKMD